MKLKKEQLIDLAIVMTRFVNNQPLNDDDLKEMEEIKLSFEFKGFDVSFSVKEKQGD